MKISKAIRLFFPLLISFISFGQLPFSGTKIINASQNMTLDLFIDPVADTVEIKFTGPANIWRGIGFGATTMLNTYAIITDGNGNIEERKLGANSAGVVLSNSLISVNHFTTGAVSTTRVTRSLTGLTSDHFTFPDSISTVFLVWAYGTGVNLGNHAGRGATSISIATDCSNHNTSASISPAVCNSYQSPLGLTYTNSGIYIETIPNSVGCDSVITINLSVNTNGSDTMVEACSEYIAPSGAIFDQTGTYSDTILNVAGCDSIITIELEILKSFSNVSDTLCGPQVSSQSGNQIWTSSGIYTDTILNSVGCDSIMTVDLTLLQTTTSSITIEACNSYISPSGIVYTSSGIYNDTINNSIGCDSIIQIDLQVTNVDFSVIISFDDPNFQNHIGEILNAVQPNANYQWIDCNNGYQTISGENGQQFAATNPGNYAVIVSDGICNDTSECINVTLLSIQEEAEVSMSYFPNPTKSQVFFQFKGQIDEAKISLYSVLGQLISELKLNESGKEIVTLPSESGVYFAKVQINGEHYKTIKLIMY